MAPAPATRRARSWTSWFLAVGTAVGVGAAVYHYHRSAERLRRDDERRRDDDDDAATAAAAAAAASDRPSPARSSANAAPSPRPTKKEKQQAAASRAQLELLASFDGASGSVDPANAAFERAAARVETIVRRLSAPDKLRVYALYKQATEGPCSAPKPRLMDGLTKHAKWSAWKDLGDLPPEDAKAAYVRLVDQLAGGAEGATEGAEEGAEEGADDGGFGGPVFSRPEMPVAERTEASAARAAARAAAAAAAAASPSPSASASDQFIDPDAVDPHGFLNPLSDACRRGDLSAVRRAAAAGSDPNCRDDEGRSPLHWAADGGHAGVIAALLAMGAEVDAVDDEGQTALHYAATVESAESCRLLLEAGADPEAEDDDGDTPESLGAIALAKTTPGA